MTDPDGTATELSGRLSARIRALYDSLDEMSAALAAALERNRRADRRLGPLGPAARDAIESHARAFLARHPVSSGAGVIFSVDRIVDDVLLIEWWGNATGSPARVRFEHRPEDRSYYDFQDLPWFAIARDTRRHAIAGPYIDWLGVDEYIMTLTSPLVVGAEFAGVVGCDITIEALEGEFVPLMRAAGRDAAVVSDDGHVVVSSDPRLLPGDRVRRAPAGMRAVRIDAPGIDLRLLVAG